MKLAIERGALLNALSHVQNIVENFDQVFADSGDEVDYDEIELEQIESFYC